MKKTLTALIVLFFVLLPQTVFGMSVEDFVVSDQVDDNDKYYFYARMLIADMTLEEKVAQLFMIDPEMIGSASDSFTMTEEARQALSELAPGGVMIRGKNIRDAEQLRKLCEDMQQNTVEKHGIPLFIAAEEEGGYVERIGTKLGFSDTMTMEELGKTGYEEDAYMHGTALGERLSSLGINMNFAPYAVISDNKDTDGIVGRHLSEDPDTVARLTQQIVRGMHEKGVMAVMKHFPTEDALQETIKDSEDSIKNKAIIPYEVNIRNGLGYILVTNQPVYELSGNVPASLSGEICTKLLREEMRFEGVIVSDLLTDNELFSVYYSRDEAVIQSILAGCDMFLLSEDFHGAVDAVVRAVERNEITEERLNQSVIRIVAGKIIHGLIE